MHLITRYSLAALLLAAGTADAALYKWVDENGVTRYTTTLPPESARYDREVITKQGRTVKTISGARTPEEIAEAERLQKEQEKKLRSKKEAEKRDRALLAAYRSIEDIEFKREQRLKSLNLQIDALEKELQKSREEYADLVDQAVLKERSGQMPPEDLKGKLRSAQRENDDFLAQLEEAKDDRVNTIQAFDHDVQRFKKLKGIK